MALTPTQEAQVLQLVAEQAALLSLADNEATIISKLGATKVNLSSLGSAATFDDADIMLIRQGTTDLSVAGSVVKAAVAVPDATDTVKGKSSLAVAANYPSVSDTESATPAYVSSAVAAAPSVTGLFSNLKASATGLSAVVTITADELIVKNGTSYKTLTSVSVTPSLAVSGVNGLDTGTSAINTWYVTFVIWNPTTLAVAGLLSLNDAAPTMPSGYTFKARTGWIRTDGTANKYPLSFVQTGKVVSYKVGGNVPNLPICASGVAGNITTPTFATIGLSSFLPPTAGIVAGRFIQTTGAASAGGSINPNANYGPVFSATNPPACQNVGSSSSAIGVPFKFVLESSNLFWNSNNTVNIVTIDGWEDNL